LVSSNSSYRTYMWAFIYNGWIMGICNFFLEYCDWLIDWCLTPTLAMFQLPVYRGVSNILYCFNHWYAANKYMYINFFFKLFLEKEITNAHYPSVVYKSSHISSVRRVWRNQRGNHNPYIEEEQTTQWSKKITKKSTKHYTENYTFGIFKLVLCIFDIIIIEILMILFYFPVTCWKAYLYNESQQIFNLS
jgi:hypothetical protein